MAGKIGHNYSRDPYPWDGAETLKRSSAWECCDMKLPPSFHVCPICGRERQLPEESAPIPD